ncbi:MAG: redoxin domain-containing protein [Ruminococcaceae bacterium]|nr:redoxin domain-containing protein [Oscillospiraceae bacterium]
MNKKVIRIIVISLAVLLIGVAVVFAVQSGNDAAKDDEIAMNDSDKEKTPPEADDTESKESGHEKDETENVSAGTTQTQPSVKDPAQTEVPSKNTTETKSTVTKSTSVKPTVTNPTETKPTVTKSTSAKPTVTKSTVTKPTEIKPTVTKPTVTKPTVTKPTETKPTEIKPTVTKPTETKPTETKPTVTKPTEPERNEPVAADFTVFDENGNQVRLSDYAGKPVILNFWASWCVPCKKEMPDFNEKYLEYGEEIQFLMIDFAKDDKIEDAKQYVSEMGFAFPIFFDVDGDVVSTYEIKGFPTTIFIDADGYIVERVQGTLSAEKLQAGIDKILE